jgi:beta-galactosidase
LIAFRVWGDGKLIGVGNGNPNCQESDKGSRRSLFHGLAQIIVQSTKNAGEIRIEATNQGADDRGSLAASLAVKTKSAKLRPSVPAVR